MMASGITHILFQMLAHKPPACNSVRLYGRWTHRMPAKVLMPFDAKSNLKQEKIIDLNPSILNKNKGIIPQWSAKLDVIEENKDEVSNKISAEKSKEIKQNRDIKLKKRKFFISQQKVFDINGNIIYEKLKENDSRVSSMFVKLKSKKERQRTGQTLVEGWRLIVDGLVANCSLKYVIFSKLEDLNHLKPFLPKTGVIFYKIPYKEIELWSDVVTSPGIFGVFEVPTAAKIKGQSAPLPLQFICDNIREPGNLGTILRVAVGAGCEKVILSKGCVDPWDPKVIRSAAGAHFRLPIYNSVDWEDIPKHLAPNTSLFIADSNASFGIDGDDPKNIEKIDMNQIPVLPYYSVEFSSLTHTTLIIGGETEGISDNSYQLAAARHGMRLNIPLQKGVDSLNTGMASAVMAFEIRKQLIQSWSKQKLAKLGHVD